MKKLAYLIIVLSLGINPSQASQTAVLGESGDFCGLDDSSSRRSILSDSPIPFPLTHSTSTETAFDVGVCERLNSPVRSVKVNSHISTQHPLEVRDVCQTTQGLKRSSTEVDIRYNSAISARQDHAAEIEQLFEQVLALPRTFELTTKDNEHIKNTLSVAYKAPDCELSGFRVGTIIIIDDVPYPGVNNEDPTVHNVACGERCAMWGARPYMGKLGESTKITQSYVFAIDPNTKKVETGRSSSCGLCRGAYSTRGNPDIFFIYEGKFMKMKAHDLLPMPYLYLPKLKTKTTKRDGFRSEEEHLNNIMQLPNDTVTITTEIMDLFKLAIFASQCAYAPYHGVREGAALWVESDLFPSGSKIFDKGNYQNASYGAAFAALGMVIADAKYALAKLARESKKTKYTFILKGAALFGLNDADELLSDVTPSGPDRQVAAEEIGGLKLPVYFVYKNKITCRTIGQLLPFAFTFIDIIQGSKEEAL